MTDHCHAKSPHPTTIRLNFLNLVGRLPSTVRSGFIAVSRAPADWIQAALTGIGLAAVVTDAAGKVLFISPVAETLTGWTQSEAAGLSVAVVFRIQHEATRRPATDPVTEVLLSGKAVSLADHTVLIGRDGNEIRIDQGADPIRDASGAIVGAVLIFCDVSERQRLIKGVEDARALAEGIVHTVREPLVVLDSELRVRLANRAYYQTFEVTSSETEGRLLFDLGNRQWIVPRLHELLTEMLARDSSFNDFSVERDFARIGRRVMVLNARCIPPAGPRPGLILLAIEDATQRRRAADAVALSEARYRRLFETAQDGILLVDPDTRQVFDANPFLMELLAYTHEELVGKELWEIGLFQDIDSSKVAFRTLQEKGYIRYDDLPLRTKTGQRIEVEFVSNVYSVGAARVIQCNIRDVIDRKRAEEALWAAHSRLEVRVADRTIELARTNEILTAEIARREKAEAERRELQRRLTTAQEDERRRIARELHDELGQHLTGLGLGLKVLKDSTPHLSPVWNKLQELQGVTDLIGREVHHLARELRPTVLDDLGLQTALGNYAETWAERSGIDVDFQCIGMGSERLPAAVETALYRVVQEALTNVLKHARAKRVSLILQFVPSRVTAIVEDDGCGFDVERSDGTLGEYPLGLLGMRERMELLGGILTIDAVPGRGSTVIAAIPLEPGVSRDV
jgi:PAS domain S-box-containing protein